MSRNWGSGVPLWNRYNVDYVIFMGNVGVGKSTLVEKLADVRGQSSDDRQSFTKQTKLFWSRDRRLLIADTPGANPMKDKLQHNENIAVAFNHTRVKKVFIVVKADTRIDTTVHHIREYAEQFLDLDPDVLGVIVTHMDQVAWTSRHFMPDLSGELGITDVVFSSNTSAYHDLQRNILCLCRKSFDISVDGEEFFNLFKIHNNNVKILRSTKKIVDTFKAIKTSFDEQRPSIAEESKADLFFEFQAFMTDYIVKAQQQLTEDNNFTFSGAGAANEVGHVANMTNQLRAVLYDIRIETLQQATHEHGVNELRKCPHCGQIWALIVGCDGKTTCGNLVNEMDATHKGVMATFTFVIIPNMKEGLTRLIIKKSGEKTISKAFKKGDKKIGCGNSIEWKEMRQVSVPPEFREGVSNVNTRDIRVGPSQVQNVTRQVDKDMKRMGQNLAYGN